MLNDLIKFKHVCVLQKKTTPFSLHMRDTLIHTIKHRWLKKVEVNCLAQHSKCLYTMFNSACDEQSTKITLQDEVSVLGRVTVLQLLNGASDGCANIIRQLDILLFTSAVH